MTIKIIVLMSNMAKFAEKKILENAHFSDIIVRVRLSIIVRTGFLKLKFLINSYFNSLPENQYLLIIKQVSIIFNS